MATGPLDVVVVGGSLAGLMHGIMIKRLGHNVRILEQYPTSIREGQAAGMSTGVYGQKFLEKHDRVQDRPHFVTASYLRVVDVDLNLTELRTVPFKLTNWKTFYYRLRANFDSLSSEYVLKPPQSLPTDGTILYDVGKRVKGVAYEKESGLTITSEDVETGVSTSLHPDLIIAADGANSTIRKLLFPELETPYAGYLTWRGVIPEKSISEETLNFLHDKAIRYYTDGSYIVVYIIPGEDGNITPGERHVNLVWYYNCAKESTEYTTAMTDIDGLQHRRTVPFGKVQPKVWAKQQAYSSTTFAAPIKEMVDKIDKPFVTAISDCMSPRCSFYDGKLFLVGDALALFRPHVAESTNQSALHCLLLEKLLQGQLDLAAYEKEVMMFAHTTLLWSREIGSQYLYSRIGYIYHKTRSRLARKGKRWGVRL